YPDGSHNAETLMVHPKNGDLYIVTKETLPGVYVARAPLPVDGSTTTLTKIATLSIGQTIRNQATGGDISPDGTKAAIATYGDGYESRLPPCAASFDAIWQTEPQAIALGLRPQGESIAYRLDGNALLTTSERPAGVPGPIHLIEHT